ncbi:PEGA domain-containing protein [Granulicella paludicola]|uniref:PEGA domain-containing protein n=1 Tax=Granulicella paludicola TaxID=474951 RepID=UPI0021E05320|nr:PEGA domain-containing protein [Granulicella paludicola]
MKSLLSVFSILWLALGCSSALAAGKPKVDVQAKVKATSRMYRVRGVLKPGIHVMRASSALVLLPAEAAAADDASAGYDAVALSVDHHVRCLIAAEPADAVIYVDGKRAGTSPTEVDWEGRAGDLHTVTVQKDGWRSSEGTFTQGVGDAAIYVRLSPVEDL